jgi:MFS family permease
MNQDDKSVVVLNLSAFLTMLGVGMVMAVLPRRILELSGSVSGTGYLAAAFALTFVLFQIPVGRLSDRFGARIFLGAGYLACGASGIIYLVSGSTGSYLAGRMLQGLGEIPIWSLAPAMLSVHHPLTKGRYIGIYNAAIHAGLALGSLSGILVQRIFPENGVFVIFTALSLLCGVLILKSAPDDTRGPGSGVKPLNWREVARQPGFPLIYAGICCYGAGYGAFISIIPAFLMDARGAGPGLTGVYFMLFTIGTGLSQILAGPISDRYGREAVMAPGLAATGLGLALFSLVGRIWLLPLLFLAAAGLGMFCVSSLAFLNDRVPKTMNGTITGAFYFVWGIGYSSGPLILGAIGGRWGWTPGFLLAGGIFILLLIACLAFRRHSIRAEHPDSVQSIRS